MLNVIRVGYFAAIMAFAAVHAYAADQSQRRITGVQNQTWSAAGGVYQAVGTIKFECGKTTCGCKSTADCFDMGTAGVCKDKIVDVKGQPGKGTCTAK